MNTAVALPDQLLQDWFPADIESLAGLRGQVKTVVIAPDQCVFHQGDACEQYLVVLQGCVRVQALSVSGREIVLYRVKDGESCVITTSCLLGREEYPAEGITETETRALAIPRPVFDRALEQSATFRRFVFQNQGARLSDLIRRVEDVAFGRLDAKLARFLMDWSQRHDGEILLTHQQLATELGTAREVISRQLKQFERRGWLVAGRGKLLIRDLDALERLAASLA